ncbi:MAG: hypothetical protein KJN98_03570, partial [Pontiella sp.]|nr:hypothetical protein [Pontiella sp.]
GTVDQQTRILGRDIVYLKPQPKEWKRATDVSWYRTTLFKILLPLPALLLFVVAGTTARRHSLAGDVARARRQKAPKAARKHVALAQQAMRRGDAAAFYEALWEALTEYFGHRLNLAPGEVTRQTVADRLPGDTGSVEALFDTIEQRRYGIRQEGEQSESEMENLLRQLTLTLKQSERMKL